jgi:hypothetical protein
MALSNLSESVHGLEMAMLNICNFTGIICFIMGVYGLYRFSLNPDSGTSSFIKPLLCSFMLFGTPQIMEAISSSDFERVDDSSYSTNVTTTNVMPTVEKIAYTKKQEPTIKPEPKKVYSVRKETDYTQFFIVSGYIVGGIISLFLTVFGFNKLMIKLRMRRYEKVVKEIAILENDFVTLSENISTIDSYLQDINQYKKTAPSKLKIALDGMQSILENKKKMFNNSINDIHEMQPDLKVIGASI